MSIVIIGSGFAGLCMGIRLRKAGIEDFVILEKGSSIGGTWRDNDYPGCACDVQSHMYSYSFEPNPRWSRMFAPQKEIRAYIERVAAKYGLMPHVRLNQAVKSARYSESDKVWDVSTAEGDTYRASVLIAATGGLSNPAYPKVKGLDTFQGEKFHSAHWNHGYDLSGKRVAVIGTGASAIQFVPQIQKQVAKLHLFQRTAPWVIRKPDRAISAAERWMFDKLPFTQRMARRAIYWACEARVLGIVKNPKFMDQAKKMALRYLEAEIKDPELRKKLTPTYAMGCKRILMSNDYYEALAEPNIEVVSEGIREVRAHSVITDDGVEREVDAIIFGTGFTAQQPVRPGMVIGKRGIDILDRWGDAMEAFKGSAIDGYPNFFFLVGPNTGLGHNSMIYMIEALSTYITDAIQQMRANSWRTVEVKPEALREYNDRLQAKVEGTVWQVGGCKSWYQNDAGRNTALWPDFTFKFREEVAQFDANNYAIDSDAVAERTPERAAAPTHSVASPV
jgi:cation diffusion facilitator CzcD-associated flavoprotein CzcO